MIVAGVWTGVEFSNMKNCRTQIRIRFKNLEQERSWSLKKWLRAPLTDSDKRTGSGFQSRQESGKSQDILKNRIGSGHRDRQGFGLKFDGFSALRWISI